jgi:hypothetical protein
MIRDNLRLIPAVYIPGEVGILDRSPFDFYLAGSRYMGCARPDSDWDFLAQDSAEIRRYLKTAGFRPLFEEYPITAGNTVEVFQRTIEGHKVQVQLQRDVNVQRTIRDIIKTYMLERHIKMDREARTELWNMLHCCMTMPVSSVVVVGF